MTNILSVAIADVESEMNKMKYLQCKYNIMCWRSRWYETRGIFIYDRLKFVQNAFESLCIECIDDTETRRNVKADARVHPGFICSCVAEEMIGLPGNSKPTKISRYCLLAIFTRLSLVLTPALRRLSRLRRSREEITVFRKGGEIKVFWPGAGSFVSSGTVDQRPFRFS